MIIEVHDFFGNTYTYQQNEKNILADREILAQRDALFQVMSTNDGELFNPYDATANIRRRDNQRGGYAYKLIKCSKACWESYVSFLKTRNRRHLNVAKRRFIDG